MTKKIFYSILLAVTTVLLIVLLVVIGYLYNYYRQVQEVQLNDELQLAACAVENSGQEYLQQLASADSYYTWTPDSRLTWIAKDGTVLFDTVEPAQEMENHSDRIEIKEALTKGESRSVRYSHTLTEETLYYAKKLQNGTVLRISISQATMLALVLGMLKPLLLVAIFAVLLSALLARFMAKKIVRPLNLLDLDNPLENDAYDELSPLLRRIHQQHEQITAQLKTMQKKADEFAQITRHMNEGLIVLDNAGKILSINKSAQKIFQVNETCIGQEFLQVEHSHDLCSAMQSLQAEILLQRNKREYQIDISQIKSEGTTIGTVLLAFDVTERAMAERSRKEFTANVSHELKTPLQVITGSAELLKNGLVKKEDIPQFIGSIHTEATRLIAMVEDIIHLSQLDEGIKLSPELVDLYALAEEVVHALQNNAKAKNVQIKVFGEKVFVNGVRGLLYEMLYNLCDNAIKYSPADGQVEICAGQNDHAPFIFVKDTGIGISEENQTRIFERFFRVDKSRSKASGGTGLGLSLVKHIAQYHHAKIDLQSQPGTGTIITVTFNK